VFVVLITGPPGAGKSTVLEALVDALSDDDVPHAAVEVEALVWTHPALTGEQRLHHVRTACELHRAAGHRLLLMVDTVETDADLTALLDAAGAEEHLLVRLQAAPDTLAARIVAREPPTWSGRDALVGHARALALSMPALSGVDLVLDTDGRRPADVAAAIRAARPERLGGPARSRGG
jgi:chloramphenicol 3-O-phosphotransferase